MKIAMIGHKRIPSREGGIEVVVQALSTRMVALGHHVDVYNRMGKHVADTVHSKNPRAKEFQGVRLITIPTLPQRNFNAIIYSFLATIRALFGRYDVIHFHAEGPAAMCWLPRLFRIRTVVTIHGLDWQRAKWGNFASRYLRFGERMAARHADEVIVLSHQMQRYFAKTYGRHTVFIPNGVDTPNANTPLPEGLFPQTYYLYAGRIVPEKGIHYLLEAYHMLDTDMPLVIAGGASHSEEYMHLLREKGKPDPRVHFLGFVEEAVLQSLFANAYVCVFPSDVEGMPLSLLEALSTGCCCLVSNIDEHLEIVGEYAPTFCKGDVQSLQSAMAWLLSDTESVQTFRQNSADFVLARHNWDEITARTLAIYQDKSPPLKC